MKARAGRGKAGVTSLLDEQQRESELDEGDFFRIFGCFCAAEKIVQQLW